MKNTKFISVFTALLLPALAGAAGQVQNLAFPTSQALREASEAHGLSFTYRLDDPTASLTVCLEATRPGGRPTCVTLTPGDSLDHDILVGFPYTSFETRFTSGDDARDQAITHVGALFVQSSEGGFQVSDLRLDRPAYRLQSRQVAQVLSSREDTVKAFRALELDPTLAWMLVLLNNRCGITPDQVMAQRATKHWGEIAEDCGTPWPQLVNQLEGIQQATGLRPQPATRLQGLRTASNRPNDMEVAR